MSTRESEAVSCVRLPLRETFLLLPSAALEAVVAYQAPDPAGQGPEWLLGMIVWQDRPLPVVSLEGTAAAPDPTARRRSHIVVVKALGGDPGLTHLGILVHGFPQAVTVGRANLGPRTGGPDEPWSLCSVALDGEGGIIPDLDSLERELLAALREMPS